jgi:aarF domain-containing kinase
MQSDPNPANFYFDKKKYVLNLIDFGACHDYSKLFIDNYIEMINAAMLKKD